MLTRDEFEQRIRRVIVWHNTNMVLTHDAEQRQTIADQAKRISELEASEKRLREALEKSEYARTCKKRNCDCRGLTDSSWICRRCDCTCHRTALSTLAPVSAREGNAMRLYIHTKKRLSDEYAVELNEEWEARVLGGEHDVPFPHDDAPVTPEPKEED